MREDDEKYQLTPKGIFWVALNKVGLVNDLNDHKYESAWTIFELMMKQGGYIVEEEVENGQGD